jgi:hypothetical protein
MKRRAQQMASAKKKRRDDNNNNNKTIILKEGKEKEFEGEEEFKEEFFCNRQQCITLSPPLQRQSAHNQTCLKNNDVRASLNHYSLLLINLIFIFFIIIFCLA